MAKNTHHNPIKAKSEIKADIKIHKRPFQFDKTNGIPILVSLILASFLFYMQVHQYPHPEMFSDSGSYLTSAVRKVLGYRPIGYSWIISFFHSLSPNLHFLPIAQFILHIFSSLLLTQTVLHFVPVKNNVLKYVFHLMVISSPWAVQITNAVMSDSAFLSLTYIWFASLLWIAFSKDSRIQILFLVVHILALYLAYLVRYIAMIYPLMSGILFFMTLSRWKSLFLTLGLFIVIILANKKNDTVIKKALGPNAPKSSFAGWLLGNNASPILGHSKIDGLKITDKDIRFVQEVMTHYPDSIFTTENALFTNFIWHNALAGKEVVRTVMQRDNIGYFQAWFKAGAMVGKWGKWLIFKKPLEYFRYFLWPNGLLTFKLYPIYEPPLFTLDDDVQKWYSYPIKDYTHQSHYNTNVLSPMVKILGLIQWLALFGSLFFIFKQKLYLLKTNGNKIMIFSLLFILFYFGFHILASPLINYRYHILAYAPLWINVIFVADFQILKLSKKPNLA